MSCFIVTLHEPVYCVKNNASIRLYQPNLKKTGRARAAVNRQGYFLICCLILKERELFLLQFSGLTSVLASLSRRPGYQKITKIQRLDILKQVHVLLTCHVVLDVMND